MYHVYGVCMCSANGVCKAFGVRVIWICVYYVYGVSIFYMECVLYEYMACSLRIHHTYDVYGLGTV